MTELAAVEAAVIHGVDFYVLDYIDSWVGRDYLLQQVTQDFLYI
jgi:hypothetical protein